MLQTEQQSPIPIAYILGTGSLGGVERHVQAIVQNLDRSRFTPSAIFLLRGGPIEEAFEHDQIETFTLNGKSGWDPGLVWKLRGTLKKISPALVHSHEMHAAIGLCMRSLPSLPWIHTEHCSFEYGPSPSRARLLWRMSRGRLDSVLTVSTATGQSLCRNTGLPASKVSTLFNGIDFSVFPRKDPDFLRRELGLPPDCPLVGSVGRMVHQKGWPDFLAMAEALSPLRPDCHFVLIGDGPDRAALEDSVRSTRFATRCHFLGARTDAVALIGAMDIFVLASIHEELPTTLLESFKMETPAVGFVPEGGVADMLSLSPLPVGRFLPNRDPAALASIAAGLLSDPEQRLSLTRSGLKLVEEHFSMATITRSLEDRYLSLLNSTPRR